MSESENHKDLRIVGKKPSTLYQYYANTAGEINVVLVNAIVTPLRSPNGLPGDLYRVAITVEAGPLDVWSDTVDAFTVPEGLDIRGELELRIRESVAEALPHLIYNRNERQQRKQEIALLEGDKE